MQINIHEAYRKIVALSDSNLLGKKFEEGIKQIEIRETFFKGEEITKEKAIQVLQEMQKEDATFSIVGKEAVKTALQAGIIDESGIIKIQEVPVALVLL